jgi:hypothetical protein
LDEASAIAIADGLARARFAGRLELLGVQRLDRDAAERFFEAQWREGCFFGSGVTLEVIKKLVARRFRRSRWFVHYLAYGPEFRQGITTASVSIDEESGSAVWEVCARPPE